MYYPHEYNLCCKVSADDNRCGHRNGTWEVTSKPISTQVLLKTLKNTWYMLRICFKVWVPDWFCLLALGQWIALVRDILPHISLLQYIHQTSVECVAAIFAFKLIYFLLFLTHKTSQNIGKKSYGSGGIRTHASEETGALNQRLRPLGHATVWNVTDIPGYQDSRVRN